MASRMHEIDSEYEIWMIVLRQTAQTIKKFSIEINRLQRGGGAHRASVLAVLPCPHRLPGGMVRKGGHGC